MALDYKCQQDMKFNHNLLESYIGIKSETMSDTTTELGYKHIQNMLNVDSSKKAITKIDAHLMNCADCAEYVNGQLREIDKILASQRISDWNTNF